MFRKDDVVYYKTKLQKLFKDAKDNEIKIEIKDGVVLFLDKQTGEIASVKL